jgi:RNA polymerase sigma factor (sigma-70 family)
VVDAQTDARELVRRAVEGDEQAWRELVRRHAGAVYAVARSYQLNASDASDVSQIVWLRLWCKIGDIREPQYLAAWLSAVTRHECVRLLRRAARELPVDQDAAFDQVPDPSEIDQDLLAAERDSVLARAIDALPRRGGALMRFLLREPTPSYAKVSQVFDMPIGSIGPTRQRCLELLRSHPDLRSYQESCRS